MARVISYRNSRTEEDREEMSPVAVGLTIGIGGATGLALGLAIRSAMADSDAPFEASEDAVSRVQEFENEDGANFKNHQLRGAGLAAVLTAAPFVKIPKDLDPKDLPAAIPANPEEVIDYIEDHLDHEVSDKQAKKIRRRFEKLEKEFEKRDEEKDEKGEEKPADPTDEEEEDDDEEEEA